MERVKKKIQKETDRVQADIGSAFDKVIQSIEHMKKLTQEQYTKRSEQMYEGFDTLLREYYNKYSDMTQMREQILNQMDSLYLSQTLSDYDVVKEFIVRKHDNLFN